MSLTYQNVLNKQNIAFALSLFFFNGAFASETDKRPLPTDSCRESWNGATQAVDANSALLPISWSQGFQTAVEKIEVALQRKDGRGAVFVSVWGYPDSGKSYIIEKIGSHFEAKGVPISRGGGDPQPASFFGICRETADTLKDLGQKKLYLLHNTVPREMLATSEFSDRNPDQLVASAFTDGTAIEFHIGIFNPRERLAYTGRYDILISNDRSQGSVETAYSTIAAQFSELNELALPPSRTPTFPRVAAAAHAKGHNRLKALIDNESVRTEMEREVSNMIAHWQGENQKPPGLSNSAWNEARERMTTIDSFYAQFGNQEDLKQIVGNIFQSLMFCTFTTQDDLTEYQTQARLVSTFLIYSEWRIGKPIFDTQNVFF